MILDIFIIFPYNDYERNEFFVVYDLYDPSGLLVSFFMPKFAFIITMWAGGFC